ncbi:MAG TPA: S26 family signal peptidase [Stackebrandtia sp.]|jgi:signal peptidase I|uniref:S26 family signal peptidase n=1 Tax=Stackebrandtia sp. TaxID=2023065 RepID=UPI002D59D4CE|nr:S26 family signal peptidase [Stackebrandtia sp.]HZE41994.1 S26 family signal peptidase [Stackebrandtia sp.]
MAYRRSRGFAALALASGLVALSTVALWRRRRFVAITVDGMSMSPALYPGDKVMIRRGIKGLDSGRIVVVARPNSVYGWKQAEPATGDLDVSHWFIKRVAAVGGDPYPPQVPGEGTVPSGHVIVLGDNQRHSDDSRLYGPCPVDQILGVKVGRVIR